MNLPAKKLITPPRLIVPGIILFVFCLVFFPAAVFSASKTGAWAWWNLVLPALLPFFIVSELLLNYGVIQFMGVLLEPVMRPLFNLPGTGSFVLAVGYTSGFPISASLTARLRKDKLCTRLEAERLMSFTNNASPLFLLVAVGVGMFNHPRVGVLIAFCHYTANLVLGFLLRFYQPVDPEFRPHLNRSANLFGQAVSAMQKAYRFNPRPFGKILGEAVASAINKLLVIGGFVVIFSVIIKLSVLTGVISVLSKFISLVAVPLGFTESAIRSLSYGFFEITLGTKAAAEAAAPLAQQATAASVILGWSGLSVLAQVSAMIGETDLKMGLFVLVRFLHAVFAGLLCFLLFQAPACQAWLAAPAAAGPVPAHTFSWWTSLCYFSRLCLWATLAWVLLGLLVSLLRPST